MADVHTKEKIRQKLKDLKAKFKHRKVEGDPKIEGISRPKKRKKGKPKKEEARQLTAVGPRGGRYKVGRGGKKQYQGRVEKSIKAALQELAENKFETFVEKFKSRK